VEIDMLSDVFVPLFTFPDEIAIEPPPGLSGLLGAFAAHVAFCGVEIDVPDLKDRWGAQLAALPQMAEEVERRSRERAASMLKLAMGVPADFQGHAVTLSVPFVNPGLAVARQARNHDVTVMLVRAGTADGVAISEHILFGSGRPLLLLPADRPVPARLGRVAIAWDGGATAYRAVHDAMPLVVAANDVVVLTAPADKQVAAASTQALLGYLGRHGVEPRLVEVASGQQGIGHDLQAAAMSQQADLLVMGAYGHSRLREFVLGGATSGVLNQTSLPVLMSR
jgi:nucleotide-binding universal stress UspA family protein